MKYFLLIGFLFLSEKIIAQTRCVSGDCCDGFGTELFANGESYSGQWVNGEQTGLGEFTWEDGSYAFGYFKKGQLDSTGYFEARVGFVVTGNFKNNICVQPHFLNTDDITLCGNCVNGTGIYFYASGAQYVGEWKNGIREGMGKFIWPDGSYFCGEFQNNLCNGNGFFHDCSGKIQVGYFKNNSLQQPTAGTE